MGIIQKHLCLPIFLPVHSALSSILDNQTRASSTSSSQAVSHPSTVLTLRLKTSLFEWESVYTVYLLALIALKGEKSFVVPIFERL